MNDSILELSNEIVYKGMMKHGNKEVALQKVLMREEPLKFGEEWLHQVLQPHRKVVFVNTDGLNLSGHKIAKKKWNETETIIIKKIVRALEILEVEDNSIGVITPFVEQQNYLKKAITSDKRVFKNLQILTIDKSQGIDKDIIIISCVKHDKHESILRDFKRINVAFTRAKKKLIIVGSFSNLVQIKPMDQFMLKMKKENWIVSVDKVNLIKDVDTLNKVF